MAIVEIVAMGTDYIGWGKWKRREWACAESALDGEKRVVRPGFLRWVRLSRQSDGESMQKGRVEDD